MRLFYDLLLGTFCERLYLHGVSLSSISIWMCRYVKRLLNVAELSSLTHILNPCWHSQPKWFCILVICFRCQVKQTRSPKGHCKGFQELTSTYWNPVWKHTHTHSNTHILVSWHPPNPFCAIECCGVLYSQANILKLTFLPHRSGWLPNMKYKKKKN